MANSTPASFRYVATGEKCVIVNRRMSQRRNDRGKAEILVVGQWYPPCACVRVKVKVKVKAKTQFYWPSGHESESESEDAILLALGSSREQI